MQLDFRWDAHCTRMPSLFVVLKEVLEIYEFFHLDSGHVKVDYRIGTLPKLA